MADGIVAELKELIALKACALSSSYPVQGKALRLGTHLSTFRGRGMDFSEVRNYQAGDEIRHMEWRVTARTGRPHVKIYQAERERPVVLLVDFNPSMIFGTKIAFKSVIAARLAALLAWTVIKQGDKIGGFLFSATQHSEFIPKGRDAGVLPLLASLSDYTHQKNETIENKPTLLSDALVRLRRVTRPGSLLVLISDFYSIDQDCEKHLQRLSEHNDLLAYHICDPIELASPPPQLYPITNGSQEIVLDTRQKRMREAYDQYCQQKIARLKKLAKRLNIPYIQTTAKMDLASLINQTFPRRSRG